MCKVGDIIVVKDYTKNGTKLGKHSFIVLSDKAGQIQGLDYDIICNVMSSFKNNDQRNKKLSYPGNFPIEHDDSNVVNGNNKSGYIKAEQFYYFNKEKTDFVVIGSIKEEVFNMLIEFIHELNIEISTIIDNL